jgi:fatty acid desaturase
MVQQLGYRLSQLRQLDWAKRVGELLFFGGVLTLAWKLGWPPLAAVALNAFVLLLHEGMHGLLFQNPRANRWTAVALGGFVLISHSAYKVMHGRHHRYLGDPRDPDDYDNYFSSRKLVWAMQYIRLTIGSFLYLALIPFLALRHGSVEERKQIVGEYAVLGTVYLGLYHVVAPTALWTQWIAPLVAVGIFTNLRGLSQHGVADAHDPYLASRSMHLNRFFSFLLLNENYHLEHHLFPEVPSYNLPALHEAIWKRLPRAVVNTSYLQFLWAFLKATLTQNNSPIGLQSIQSVDDTRETNHPVVEALHEPG